MRNQFKDFIFEKKRYEPIIYIYNGLVSFFFKNKILELISHVTLSKINLLGENQ